MHGFLEQFPLLVADQMKLEPEEPTHGALASSDYALEYLVDMNALVAATVQRGAVHKTDDRTFVQKNLPDEQDQEKSHFSPKFNKAIVRDNPGEQMAEVPADFIQIGMLQTAAA